MFLMLPELEGSLPRTPPPFRGGKDRLCPTEQHGKTRGGCPCVQPGGSPGLPTGEGCFTVSESTGTGWWQLKYFLFSTLAGEMIQFDQYFSNGLKPPGREGCCISTFRKKLRRCQDGGI